ncbi:cytochrome c oxidase assembly factor Coa1 family protein [Vibrio zhugei]|uniref:Cytochrome c oxidase assembly factor Coa1 family protein n=1 Tax=Vibrio zhugei TaxID=2479546 RepID=A0ABV7C8G1_9VIBR|nr:cytochrome c oxidase assembly factor Coa1 family protein [Vibrio zhugei]
MENNTSGQGKYADIPSEIQGWNWGAFLLTWVWGIGNNTYRAFWMFCPFVNIVMFIALGLKGNEWAWRHKRWQSVEHFKRVQKKWTIASLIFIAAMLIFFVSLFFGVGSLMKGSKPYQVSVYQVQQSSEVVAQLGTPITSGFVNGSIDSSGAGGAANFSYSIEGPKGSGTVYVKANKDLGAWSIQCLVVDYEGTSGRTIIVPC